MTLFNKVGINSRLRDVKAHTYSEAYIDNNWIIADPFYGLIFFDKSVYLYSKVILKNLL